LSGVDTRIRIQEAAFDVAGEWQALRDALPSSVGAVVAFCGYVRERADTTDVGLWLEHYPGMTEKSLAAIVDEADRRWRLEAVHVVHRIGRLAPDEAIVLVLTASSHRADAFAACEFVMDYLKTDAVFWKKELGADGGAWVVPTMTDLTRRASWGEER
jgi:molybdopterin synthase catalytic subunit